MNRFVGQAVRIRHPKLIYVVIFARSDPEDFVFTTADQNIATKAVAHVNCLGFLEEPDAHFEAEIRGSQSAYGANVDGVERVIAFQCFVWVAGDGRKTAAIHETEDVVMGDFFHEADAPGAQHAAFGVQSDARPEFDVRGLFDFPLQKPGLRITVFDGEFLKAAFPSLVTNGAIQGVIDEEKLHDAFAALLNHRRIRANAHAFDDVLSAGDLGPRNPRAFGVTICRHNGFTIWAHFGHTHFD